MRIGALAVTLAAALSAPAGAFWPVIDPTAIAQAINEVNQTLVVVAQAKALVAAADQNLTALPANIALSNVQGRIAAVTGMLQQARNACQGALAGRVLPNACRVETNTANAQAAQLGAEMTQIQGLQSAARGVNGGLAAQQATAQGIIEVATQLQEMHQAQTAAALQKQIDGQVIDSAMHGPSAANPW
jgi:hypothetical protein